MAQNYFFDFESNDYDTVIDRLITSLRDSVDFARILLEANTLINHTAPLKAPHCRHFAGPAPCRKGELSGKSPSLPPCSLAPEFMESSPLAGPSEEARRNLFRLVAAAESAESAQAAAKRGFKKLNPFLVHCLTMPESREKSGADVELEETDLVLEATEGEIEAAILAIEKVNSRVNRKRKRGPEPSNSALYYYRMDVLEDCADKYPNATPADIVEVIQSQWEKLDKKNKEQYYRLAQLDKKRFDEEAKQYIPRSEGGTMKRPKRKKHPNAPKHPMSGFLYFAADNRAGVKAENPGKNFTEIAKILGNRWRSLDADLRKKYEERSDVDKARYRKEKLSFEPCPLVLEAKKRKKHPLAPKHPLSGYLYFVANNRADFNRRFPDKNFTEVANLLGQHWKQLSERDKRKYNILAAADKKRYEEEKQKWQPPIERDASFLALPKKPLTAYSFWACHQRAKVVQSRPYMDKKELTRLLREQWAKIPEKEKAAYHEKAEADRQRYQRELAMLPHNYRASVGLSAFSQMPYARLSRHERLAQVSPEVMDWTVGDVQKLLQICAVDYETIKKFAYAHINGRELVQLTASKLKANLGLADFTEIRRICRVVSLVSL